MEIASFDDYKRLLKGKAPRSVGDLVQICKEALSWEYRWRPWTHPDLDRGKAILDSQEALNAYLAAYGPMHMCKLHTALEKNVALAELQESLTIVDWGCGQGLGAAAALEHLGRQGKVQLVEAIHLIEPSAMAIERAELHLRHLAPHKGIRIEAHNKYLPSGPELRPAIEALELETPVVLHVFSNILDVETIDLRALAELISSSEERHIFVCVSPNYHPAVRRTDAYARYFENKQNLRIYSSADLANNSAKPVTAYIVNFDVTAPQLPSRASQIQATYAAGYRSDLLTEEQLAIEDTLYSVAAPFDLNVLSGASAHPILAVLANIIVRGLPTRLSPYLEERIAEALQIPLSTSSPSEIRYTSPKELDKELSERYVAICRGIAWVQRTILELLIEGSLLGVDGQPWRLLAIERDAPVVVWALEDLRQQWEHLSQLSRDHKDYQMPACHLDIIGQQPVASRDRQLELSYISKAKAGRDYALVLDIACDREVEHREYKRLHSSGAVEITIRPAVPGDEPVEHHRTIITTDKIYYDPLCHRERDGSYRSLESVEHIRYFLQLLFRKLDFRPGQLPIISRAIQHKSVIGLLPTGGGKSITYQIAALLQAGVTLVVDPLVALMQDQYSGLRRGGIDSCAYINSTQSEAEKKEVLSGMYMSRYQIVFLSPERLTIPRFRQHMQAMYQAGVYFVYGVVDEVHCVSEWGHDFRFDYLHLGRNLYQHTRPKAPDEHICLFGLTATASFDVLADVERELSGDNAFPLDNESIVRYENTNRLELQYRVVSANTQGSPRSKFDVFDAKQRVLESITPVLHEWYNELQTPEAHAYLRKRFVEREAISDPTILEALEAQDLGKPLAPDWLVNKEGAMVLFTPHRKGKMGVSSSVSQGGYPSLGIRDLMTAALPGIAVSGFVGGDDLQVVEDFVSGKNSVMVATKAFGMGIDKPDIRFTINACMSGSLEGFVQEAGRAGRDRRMALSLILYSPQLLKAGRTADNEVHQFFYNNNFKGEDYEKRVMYELMTRHSMEVAEEDEEESSPSSIAGFLSQLEAAEVGTQMKFELSYIRSHHYKPAQWANLSPEQQEFYKEYYGNGPNAEENYSTSIKKAIYRMCCIGLISDYTQDYSRSTYTITMVRRPEGGYYLGLERFLMRYYTEERAKQEVERAKSFRGTTEIMKCLGFLTDFIYSKIASKRKRAIADMEYFCRLAIEQERDGINWRVVNENLKDYLYYYFNSKYARTGYTTESGEPFSLGDDSDWGKISSQQILMKYLRVIDNDVVGTSSPRDNIKHLQGAVRLLRRGLTDDNPALDWLLVYCHLFEDSYKVSTLRAEMKSIYIQGYRAWREYFDNPEDFYAFVEDYHREINQVRRLVANPEEVALLRVWRLEAEVILQSIWLKEFSKQYGKQRATKGIRKPKK